MGGRSKGGHCEHAAWVFEKVVCRLWVVVGHCISAAGDEKQVWGACVQGSGIARELAKGDWGRRNNAAEGKGRVEVDKGKGVGRWRTPVGGMEEEMEVWGG